MDKLKALFGDGALTFEQLDEKLKDNKEVKLANLASGGFVDKKKHEDTVAKLTAAQTTIDGLKETVAKFDGVDVEGLKQSAKDWETKYNTDVEALKLDNVINFELAKAKVKNPKLVRAALDMSIIKLNNEEAIGLKEQLDTLKESDGYLFEEESSTGARVTTGGSHTTNQTTDNFMSAFMKGAGVEEKKGE